MRHQRLVALRHVEIDGRRDLAQIAHRLRHAQRRRVAVVDIKRAAVDQHHIEVVVAAEGVAPGQPVHHHRRLVGDEGEAGGDHRLVRTQHAMGVDDGLRRAGRAGGEQEFRDCSGRDLAAHGVDAGIVFGADQIGEHRRLPIAQRIARYHQFDIRRDGSVDRAREGPAVIGEHHPGREQFDDRAQFAEIGRQQRIGRRDRRIGNADTHRRQRQQRVLDIVAGDDGDRPLRRQPAPQQRRADAPRRRQHLRIAERAPAAFRVALRQKHAVGRGLGPMFERLAQRGVIGRQHLRGADMDDAARLALQHGIECAQPHRPQRRRRAQIRCRRGAHAGPRVTLGARFSRKSLSRALASGRPARSPTSAPRPRSRWPDPSRRCAAAPA